MARGKILYQYLSYDEILLSLERTVAGEYVLSLDPCNTPYPSGIQMILPGAKCDELRLALLPGFDPEKTDAHQVVLANAADSTCGNC